MAASVDKVVETKDVEDGEVEMRTLGESPGQGQHAK
jgi:hypothetical protein